jgi:hypothetical protein
MSRRAILIAVITLFVTTLCFGQKPQGFFLNGWKAKTITSPSYTDVTQTTNPVTVSLTIMFGDTLTKISPYLFGDNANLWTGPMSNNKTLMTNIANRHPGVLRGPGGSTSDVFFWNAMVNTTIDSIPATLPGSSATDWMWYGKRPIGWDNWTMDPDSFYQVLGHIDATGMITVNYGYARYGTSRYPVRKAAHLAAEWVRYDKGRSKFWEIGNEVYGSWEAGYQINTATNLDGQPQYVTGSLYGQHAAVFIDSMKAAAAKIGVDIKIGVVMVEASSTSSSWNKQVAAAVGDKADFYSVHSYYTNYNENSTADVILASATKTGGYKNYVWQQAELAGKSDLPVALTEYNIFSVGSMQAVSHVNGMHAVLVVGEAMKEGYGAACRWDLANGWSDGNDHGMFSAGDEPSVAKYAPRPAFYHMYYLQRFTGDVLLKSYQVGGSGVTIIPTAFSSGQVGAAIINSASYDKTVRLNIKNFGFGNRYYTYTLTGTVGEAFSRKVYVNGTGNSLVAGGPDNYATLNAYSSTIGDEIRITLPARSSTFVLVENGTKQLTVDDNVTDVNDVRDAEDITVFPNPAQEEFNIINIPSYIKAIEIHDLTGRTVYHDSTGEFDQNITIESTFAPGIYFVTLYGGSKPISRKLVIR